MFRASNIGKILNKRTRLSNPEIPVQTDIKPFSFKLCNEKHRSAETLKPETRDFPPIRKQLFSEGKIASPQKTPVFASVQAPERMLPSSVPTPLSPNRHGGHRPSGRGIPGSGRRGEGGKPRRNSLRNRTGPATGDERGSVRRFGHSLRMTGIREIRAAMRRPAALYSRSLFSNSRK